MANRCEVIFHCCCCGPPAPAPAPLQFALSPSKTRSFSCTVHFHTSSQREKNRPATNPLCTTSQFLHPGSIVCEFECTPLSIRPVLTLIHHQIDALMDLSITIMEVLLIIVEPTGVLPLLQLDKYRQTIKNNKMSSRGNRTNNFQGCFALQKRRCFCQSNRSLMTSVITA